MHRLAACATASKPASSQQSPAPASTAKAHPERASRNTSNIWFDNLEGEALVIALDLKGSGRLRRLGLPLRRDRALARPDGHGPGQESRPRQPALQPAEDRNRGRHRLRARSCSGGGRARCASSLRPWLAPELRLIMATTTSILRTATGKHTGTIAVAMSGGVDSSTVAAMLRAEGLSRRHRPHPPALGPEPPRRQAGHPRSAQGRPLLLAGRCLRRPPRRRDARHSLLRRQSAGALRARCRSPLRRRVSRRTHADSLLALQQPPQVRPALLTARQIGADRIATGHYAVNEYDPARGRWILKRPADLAKDQTWFLFGLTQEQLAHTLFPLGHLNKPAVREIARESGLALADKPDSQEICFIPGGDYKQFIQNYLEEQGEAVPESAGQLVTHLRSAAGRMRASTTSPSASARASASPRPTRSTS
jgi:hypothetical protein